MADTIRPASVLDPQRLAALRDHAILDTPPEEGFDDIAALAASCCHAPIALVSLVAEDRQWFKARIGLAAGETPLDASVCAFALDSPDLLVIPDLARDARTARNPLVVGEPGLRFYAGAPLRTETGHALGSLCVIDTQPRPDGLPPGEAEALRRLGRQVVRLLQLHRAVGSRDASLARDAAALAQRGALLSTQEAVAAAGGQLDATFSALLAGVAAAVPHADGAAIELRDGAELVYRATIGDLAPFEGLRVPLDGTLAGRCCRQRRPARVPDVFAVPGLRQDLHERLRVRSAVFAPVSRAGSVIAVLKLQSRRLDAFTDEDLQVARLFAGAVSAGLAEIGEAEAREAVRAGETRYRTVFDSVTDFAVVVSDLGGTVTDWNTGAERIFGWTASDAEGAASEVLFGPGVPVEPGAPAGAPALGECWWPRKDGSRFWGSWETMPLRDRIGDPAGLVLVVRDFTARHRTEAALREAEARLTRAQEAGGVGVFWIDIAEEVLHPTEHFCRLYGLPFAPAHPAAIVEELVLPDDRAAVSDASARRSGHVPTDVEYRIRRPDTGEVRWIARRGEVERDGEGRPSRFVGVARDITDQVLAREKLVADEQQLAQMFEQAPTFMALLKGPEHRIERANPGFLALIGGRRAIGRTVADALPDAVRQGYLALLDGVLRTGQPLHAEGALYAVQPEPGGPVTERYVDYVFQPIRDGGDAVTGVFVEGVDVTARRAADLALRASEERYRTLIDSIDVGFCIVEMRFDDTGRAADYRFVDVNRAFERQTGLADAKGRWMRDLAPDHEQVWFDRYGEVARTGEPLRFDSGAAELGRWFDVHALRVGGPDENRVAVLFNDISDRQQSEHALRESEERLRAITNSIDQMIWSTRPDGFHDYFNDRWYEFTGVPYGSTDGSGWNAIFHPDDQERSRALWRRSLDTGESYRIEYRLRHRSGEYRWVLGRAQPVRDPEGRITRWFGTCTDIQEIVDAREVLARSRGELEREVKERTAELMAVEDVLRQSQKMEAVGQLTGGIAHDFNNLLTAISGSLELVGKRIAQGRLADVERYTGAAQSAAKRAAALTHRLLAFSRRQTLDPKPTDVNRLVTDLEDLVRRTVGPGMTLDLTLADGLWRTLVDPGQLENAVLNLCINARDAMPDGGRITIETLNRTFGERAAAVRALPPGDYVALTVGDTGSGMTPDVVARAFEPFFTTKPLGVGTGLGLSMVYGFTRQSGGQVRIMSEMGRGTSVKILLPRFGGAEEPTETRRARTEHQPARAGEVVVVVDDEATVRMLVLEMVAELGYAALEAGDGASGLAVLRAAPRVDLLVTDVGLPGGINGRQLADAARAVRPGLKVLFITGYAEAAVLDAGQLEPGMHVLTKPFGLEALAARIQEIMTAPP